MATVTSFAEFLTAIAGSEDIVLANDIDAQAEGYDYITGVQIRCDINGQGHSISNVTISDNKYNGVFYLPNQGTNIKNTHFRNFLSKFTTTVPAVFTGSRDGPTLSNCTFSVHMDCAQKTWRWLYRSAHESIAAYDSAFDVTVQNSGLIDSTPFSSCAFYRCNAVIRKATLSTSTNNVTISPTLNNSALVYNECDFKNQSAVSVVGSGSYVALKDCTGTATAIKVTGVSSMYFCNDSSLTCDVSVVNQLTPEQLRSESYLRSIGFLP